MKNAIAPALEADPRAVELLATARMLESIYNACGKLDTEIVTMRQKWASLNKPKSEIAELDAMARWNLAVESRLLAMADESMRAKMKEFAALDESVRDEAEQALGG